MSRSYRALFVVWVLDDSYSAAKSVRSNRPGLGHSPGYPPFAGRCDTGLDTPAGIHRSGYGFPIIGPGRPSHIDRRCDCTFLARAFACRSDRPRPSLRKPNRHTPPIPGARRSRAKFSSSDSTLWDFPQIGGHARRPPSFPSDDPFWELVWACLTSSVGPGQPRALVSAKNDQSRLFRLCRGPSVVLAWDYSCLAAQSRRDLALEWGSASLRFYSAGLAPESGRRYIYLLCHRNRLGTYHTSQRSEWPGPYHICR